MMIVSVGKHSEILGRVAPLGSEPWSLNFRVDVCLSLSLNLCSNFGGVGEELREARALRRASHRADALLLSFATCFNHVTS